MSEAPEASETPGPSPTPRPGPSPTLASSPIAPEGAADARREGERRALRGALDRLWPLLRSLTGEGVRATHDVLGELLPLQRIEVPSGTPVFDWTVPPEWVVHRAFIEAPDGQRIADVREHTLHLVNYSVPFVGTLTRAALDRHLYSLPDAPDAIPYVTSYYAPRWGFCLPDRQRRALPEGDYRVVVDTEMVAGSMTMSEVVLPGETGREVLLSTYTCHPSMANNELSGPLVAAFLYRRLSRWPRRRLSYRFVFTPETIGAIAYLAMRGEHLRARLDAGYVVTCVGDPGAFTFKRSRRGDTLADRAAEAALPRFGPARWLDYEPIGSDERQYGSPGFDLPVASLMRTMYATYPEYHTSTDDRELVTDAALQGSVDAYEAMCRALDRGGASYRNLRPHGEPQLGRRGLYPDVTVGAGNARVADAIFWVLNFSDGGHDLLAIARRSGLPLDALADAAERCAAAGLLRRLDDDEATDA